MSDEPGPKAPATILARMTAAGLSEGRAREHIARGAVRVDGEHINDPDHPTPWPRAWSIGPG